MAFRRRFNPRFSRRGSPSRGVTAAVARKLDRKKSKQFQWVTLVDTVCLQEGLDCKGCCEDEELPELGLIRGCQYDETGVVESSQPNPFPLVLVAPAGATADVPEAMQQTDVFTIVRLQGWIEFCPAYCAAAQQTAQCLSDPANCRLFGLFATQFDNYHLRAGLSKDKWEWDVLANTYSVPDRFPLSPTEWSDAQFMRQWERFKARKEVQEGLDINGTAPLGCCGNVSAASAGAPANTLSNGSGTVNIPAISTECEPCTPDLENSFRSTSDTFKQYGCFRLSLNSRRRIVLKENEGLTLWTDWTSFTPFQAPAPNWRRNVGFGWRASVKALLEV